MAHRRIAVILIGILIAAAACSSSNRIFDPGSERVQMSVAPTQCGSNPWEQAGQEVGEYYASLGVTIHEVLFSQFATVLCESCACPTGQRIDLTVDEDDIAILIGDGFVRSEDWPYGAGTDG